MATILVVDDEEDIVDLISTTLEIDKHKTFKAYSGREAIDKVKNLSPELMIVDYMMPDLSGLDVIKIIKKENPTTFSIVVTGKGNQDTAVEFMKAGASDYITKPFEMNKLLNAVREVSRLRESEIEKQKLYAQLISLNKELEIARNRLDAMNQELERKVKERTEELEKAHKKLIQSERLSVLADVIVSLNHEINNPLCSISLNVALLQQMINDESAQQRLSIIMEQVDRIQKITEKLSKIRDTISTDYVSGIKMLNIDGNNNP